MRTACLKPIALVTAMLCITGLANAQDLLIRNATVHTASARGTLQATDVLVKDGRIVGVGKHLTAGKAQIIEAHGKPLTPTLFGGITDIGVEEVSGESTTVDETLSLGANAADMQVRPEFDVTLAYNPESVLVPVARVEGIGWTMLGVGTRAGGSMTLGTVWRRALAAAPALRRGMWPGARLGMVPGGARSGTRPGRSPTTR